MDARRHVPNPVKLFTTAATLILLGACGGGGSGGGSTPSAPPITSTYTYTAPVNANDGWTVTNVSSAGMDVAPIESMMQGILDGTYPGIDSVTVAHRGNLILNEPIRSSTGDFDDWIGNTDPARHCLHSTSKSVASALLGIAMDQGYIQSLDTPLVDLFPYGPYDNWDDRKRDITIANTLTMQLGLVWDEWTEPYGTPENSLSQLFAREGHLTKNLLDLRLVNNPGSRFVYNTGASIALADVIERAVGGAMEDWAESVLFEPLQIREAEWGIERTGLPNTGSGLFLTTRSMAKFGQLFLDGGVWNGQRIISEEWVNESLEQRVSLDMPNTTGYGYQWWLGNLVSDGRAYTLYSTQGYGGQFIFIVPELELVVAWHGANYTNGRYGLAFELTERFLIPALR